MADKLPAIMFYPGDWVLDPIAGCSLAAQGLWLRMLFLAHRSERYGYLEMNGSPIPPSCIAQRCGATLEQYETLLSELVSAGVPSVNESGTIYSRRMVKDASIRHVRAKSGRKGGKQKASKHPSKTLAKPKQNTEIEIENEDMFERFWKVFPTTRKGSKRKAREAFDCAIEKTDAATIVAAAREYALSETGMGPFVRMAVTWLNQEGWTDDPASWVDASKERTWHPMSADNFRELLDRKKFADGFPKRDNANPSRVYGKLRDGRSVECCDYPLPASTAR